ncbi:hypothetical protein M885DRAFT_532830 [Pelagophyceae sp. CCMP2097]|nr:hypothetical protein M885DRAFT_532830 [Pelagophyceae sp. CCMP2097]|mmetsp:Transcript_11972/g.41375  ORF Transcript_11972/g.41375 Transcript_11972/m.41375 type:complete len:194 (+) Transcript_11972:86-667(+)
MAWHAYLDLLRRQPLAVKSALSAATFALTDAVAQSQTEDEFDAARSLRCALYGGCYHGPANHTMWGSWIGLERWFPGSAWGKVLQRVAVDQTLLMPMNMAVFHAWPGLTLLDWQRAKRDVEEAFWPSTTFAWCVWPLVHPINFKFVPLEHRLLVTNVCALGVFSFATSRRPDYPEPATENAPRLPGAAPLLKA